MHRQQRWQDEMKAWSRWVGCGLFCAGLVGGSAAGPAVLADCDASAHARALTAAVGAEPAQAQAVWLDARHIRWPGLVDASRVRLHHAAAATMSVRIGEPVRGADDTLPLQAHAGPLPADVAARFRHVAAGPVLRLPPLPDARLKGLLRGQLVLVREDEQGRVREATRLQHPGALDALYARAAAPGAPPLGAVLRGTHTSLRLWAPTAQRVALCLYAGEEGPAQALVPMRRDDGTGIWQATWAGRLHGRAYTYLVDVVVPGQGLVRNRVTDPYALTLTPDSRRSVAVDLDAPDTRPPGWATAPRPGALAAATDLVVYELHVRDFSAADDSVPSAHRGRYTAFAQPASHGVRHLRDLAAAGITDVHLLPVFDLATVPERDCVTPRIPDAAPDGEAQQAAVAPVRATDCFNWGYDPLHFTAPEGSFATPGASGIRRLVEFRTMVMALHAMGLRVGMDVVYNHTSASGQHPQSVLDRIVPGYYHRLNARGEVERSTCCDNTATEHRMMARLMIDSAVVWVRDHRIDSFRFDLMGHQPRAAMEALQQAVDRAAGRRIPLIGEGWNFGEVADGARFVQASQLSLAGSGIATFNDRMRDAVRGGGAGDNGIDQLANQGWISGLHTDRNDAAREAGRGSLQELQHAADLIRAGLAGSLADYVMQTADGSRRPLRELRYGNQPAGYVTQPGEVVNYVENHDNQTLFDALVFKLPPQTPRDERARVQALANALPLLSQGIAYVHAGQELLRSKSMDRNSYDSGDWFNRIDWTGRDNGFGSGLPPREDNAASWPLMRPLLARADAIRPRPADIAFARGAFLDMLRIRSSTTLLRLRTAEDIRTRLRLLDTGPQQQPLLLAGHLDGQGYPGARFRELLVLVNAATSTQALTTQVLAGRDWQLHPVHLAPGAADARAATARADAATGRFEVPARTAVVFVVN